MPPVSGRGLTDQYSRGLLLLAGTPLLTLALVIGGQTVLRRLHTALTPSLSNADLWTHYRWSINPNERREAALLLAARSADSAERSQRLLAHQGWGNDPIAAVTLKQQALIAAKLGQPSEEQKHWQDLLQRFPDSAASADARYQLGQAHPALHTELFRQQPGHPAALAAAAETKTESPKQAIAALHLARWGARWPGAATQLREACNSALACPELTFPRGRQVGAVANGFSIFDVVGYFASIGLKFVLPSATQSAGVYRRFIFNALLPLERCRLN